MEDIFKATIEKKVLELVNCLMDKHPHISKKELMVKIKMLNLTFSKIELNSSKQEKKAVSKNVLKDLTQKKNTLKVVKTSYGNYVVILPEDPDLLPILDLNTKYIIGFETNGVLESLNKELIDICLKYKLKYCIPSNLENGDAHVESVLADEKSLEEELGLEKVTDYGSEDDDDDE